MVSDFSAWFSRRRDAFVALRHDLHAHPELAFVETRTAQKASDYLRDCGLEISAPIAKTGFVASIRGEGSAPALGLRADLDALPILEGNDFGHRSRHDGVMHACGHDGHTVMLMAAARYLRERSRQTPFPGDIHFIFQPAEENEGGGRAMVEAGLFAQFPVAQVFGMHNMPGIPLGEFWIKSGPMTAGFDTFDIVIGAEGGHAAFPAKEGDAVTAAAALVSQLSTVVSRFIGATDAAVLVVTQIHGGSAYNILPAQMRISGSVRWFDTKIRAKIRERVEMACEGLAISHGVRTSFEYVPRYPPVINGEEGARYVAEAARHLVGGARVKEDFPPFMVSEDFAFLLEANPGAYLMMGNGEGAPALHTPHYDFNDEALCHGAALWVQLCDTFFAQTKASRFATAT